MKLNVFYNNSRKLGWATLVSFLLFIVAFVIAVTFDLFWIVQIAFFIFIPILSIYILSKNNKIQSIGYFLLLSSFIWPALNLLGVSENTSNLLVAPFIVQLLLGITIFQISWRINVKIGWVYGLILGMFIAIFVLKRNHIPGAAIFLILCGFLMSTLTLANALKNFNSKNKNYVLIHSVVAIGFLFGVVGWIFKMQHWPGASFMLFINVPFYFFALLAIVFLLPNARFYKWAVDEKKGLIHLSFPSMAFLTFIFYLYFLAPNQIKRLALEKEVSDGQLIRDDIPRLQNEPLTDMKVDVVCIENCN